MVDKDQGDFKSFQSLESRLNASANLLVHFNRNKEQKLVNRQRLWVRLIGAAINERCSSRLDDQGPMIEHCLAQGRKSAFSTSRTEKDLLILEFNRKRRFGIRIRVSFFLPAVKRAGYLNQTDFFESIFLFLVFTATYLPGQKKTIFVSRMEGQLTKIEWLQKN